MSCIMAVGHPKPESIRIMITGKVTSARERQTIQEEVRDFAKRHNLKMKEVRAAKKAK